MTDLRTFVLALLLVGVLAWSPTPDFSGFERSSSAELSGALEPPVSEGAATGAPKEEFAGGTITFPALPLPQLRQEAARPVRLSSVPDIIIEADAALAVTGRGEILFAKNIDASLPIASVSKLLTALVALQRLPLDTPITVSSSAIRVEGDSAKLRSGETLSLHDLLLALLVPSSNDAAVAIAEASGGVEAFGRAMNETAVNIDMAGARFNNPHGLTPPGNFASARGVARLLQESLLDPTVAEILRQKRARAINAQGELHDWETTDALLGTVPGAIGGKTGYTTESKGTLAFAFAPKAGLERRDALSGDITVTVVVLGSSDRFTDTEALARWAMGAYTW